MLLVTVGSNVDEKLDGTKDEENMVSHVVTRRDMATQMSPRNSACSSASSLKERLPFSTSPPSIHPIVEPHSNRSAKLEIRDVQVDKRETVSKKQGVRKMQNGSQSDKDLTSSWDISEEAKNMSKYVFYFIFSDRPFYFFAISSVKLVM